MNNSITKESMLFSLPLTLKDDWSTEALAEAAAEMLAARQAEIDRLRIISNIDNLEEALLAILARDFKVDWWDANYTLEEKRRTVKDSWRVHKILGTKAAVETAIRAIYPLTTVEEWFEYGGEPYHFRLNIDITSDSGDRVRQRWVLDRLNFYKSLRSHNDGVRYFLYPAKSWALAGGGYVGGREVDQTKIPVPVLKRPGGETILIAGGGFVGSRNKGDVEINIPDLLKPGGKTILTTGGSFTGSWYRDSAEIHIPPLKISGGKTTAITGGGYTGSWSRDYAAIRVPPLQTFGGSAKVRPGGALRGIYQRIDTAASAPELARPKSAANRPAAAGVIGSMERRTVKLNTDNVSVPTGRAATGGAAGMLHSYQRIRVFVGNPAITI